MDLWNKIFPNRLKSEYQKTTLVTDKSISSTSATPSSAAAGDRTLYPFGLERKGVRVLLYRECDRRGRKLLYDSQTVNRTSIPETPSPSQCTSRLFRSPLSPRTGAATSGSQSLFSSNSLKLGSSSSSTSSTGGDKVSKGSGVAASTPRQLPKQGRRRRSSTGDIYVEVRNGFGYQYQKEASDTKHIGELLFGSVALAFKGSSSKVHLLKEPSRILMSRTFKAPRSYRSSHASCDTGIEDSFCSLSNSLSEFQLSKVESLEASCSSRPLLKPSLPLEMTVGSFGGLKASQSEGDSGFSGPSSPFSSTCGSYLNPCSLPCTPMGTPSSRSGSGSSLNKSSGSLSSLQRRFLRNVATSLESFGFASMDEEHKDENRYSSYQTKLGLAVIIETKQESPDIERKAEEWWFNQQEILETLVNKLQMALEDAYLHRNKFVSSTFQAVLQLQGELEDLVSAPRLVDPLWLSILSADSDKTRQNLYSRLIDSLSCLLNNYDTKQTNFFVSKLLTGVLTHHLGWVSTVGPLLSSTPCQRDPLIFPCGKPRKFSDTLASYLTKTLPYNALWGQLCELTGSIGYPAKVTRTVVVGSDKNLLNHILTLLSYVIRCSQVIHNHFSENNFLVESHESPSSKSDSSSRSSMTSVNTLLESNVHRNNSENSFRTTKSAQVLNKSKSMTESLKKNLQGQATGKELDSENRDQIFNETLGLAKSSSADNHSHEIQSDLLQPKSIHTGGLTTSKTLTNLSAALDSGSDSSAASSLSISALSQKLPPMNYSDLQEKEEYKQTLKPLNQSNIMKEKAPKHSRLAENSLNLKSKSNTQLKVSGEKIDLEKEQGGKVLFILGEDERLEGLKPMKKSSADEVKGDFNLNLKKLLKSKNTDFSQRRVSFPDTDVRLNDSLDISGDFRKPETYKVRGKIVPETVSEVVDFVSLSEVKKNIKSYPVECSLHSVPHCRRRNMSDPTNGAFMSRMPPYLNKLRVDVESSGVQISNKECSQIKVTDAINPKKIVDAKNREKRNRECLKGEKKTPKEKEDLEEWNAVDEHSKLIEAVRAELKPNSNSSLRVAESLIGGVLDHYSSIFALHAVTQTDQLEEQLRADLYSVAQHPVLQAHTSEAIAIVAQTEKWEIELVSSHSYAIERKASGGFTTPITYGGIPVMISPLVSQITDSMLNLIRIGAPSNFVVECFENHLRGVYLKSQLLSEYLLGTQASLSQAESCSYVGGQSQSLYNLNELTQTLGIDVNDLPLLLSVASTHTPSLTQRFGLSFK